MSIIDRLDPETSDAEWDDLAAALRAVLEKCGRLETLAKHRGSFNDFDMATIATAREVRAVITTALGEGTQT